MTDYNKNFNSDAVRVAVTGSVYFSDKDYADVKEKAEDCTIDLGADPDFTHLGILTEDALEHEFKDDTEDVGSWQASTVRTIIKSRTASVKLASLETTRQALDLFYGTTTDNVTTKDKNTIFSVQASVARPRFVAVFEFQDGVTKSGDPIVYRIVLPVGQVSEVESPKFTSGDAISWGVTINALSSSEGLMKVVTTDPNAQDNPTPKAPTVESAKWAK
ncbi:hypothetical protein O1L55_20720 [Streptomyces albulus]|nr:hypothetical protein [Streptomyces noursei]